MNYENKIIDGNIIAKKWNEENRNYLISLNPDVKPKMVIIQIGNDAPSNLYIKMKKKACDYVGVNCEHIQLPIEVTNEELIKIIDRLNNDNFTHGIFVQLPVPKQIDTNLIINRISPEKDVDGFTTIVQGQITVGNNIIAPATPKGIVKLIENEVEKINGLNIVIVGRSNIVGKPLANLLINRQATVTVCNSKTKHLNKITKEADVVILAIGKANFFDNNYFKKNQIIIDVGANFYQNKYCGDVDFNVVVPIVKKITPVPGGVGPMTVASLIDNLICLYKNKRS